MKSVKIAAALMTIGIVLVMASTVAAQLKSPNDVKTGLRLLMQVSNDFKRQITAKNFARVPREFKEYTESADAVRTAVGRAGPDDRVVVCGSLYVVAEARRVLSRGAV